MKIKRSFCLSVCAVFILAGIFAACNSSKKKGITETPTSGLIKISADQTFEPIMEQEIDVFEGLYPKANIIPVYADEVDVITSLLQDSVRLAVTTRRLSPKEVETLNARKLYPKEVKIATDGVALIVNKANPDTLITMDQLRRILTGEVTEWNQVYPESKLGKLQLVFDNPNSSTVRYVLDSICGRGRLSDRCHAAGTNREVIDYVSRTPGAMGVIGVNWISDEQDSLCRDFQKGIQVARISRADQPTYGNSYQPYQYYLYTGQYPLSRDIYILLNDPRSALPTGLTSFITGSTI